VNLIDVLQRLGIEGLKRSGKEWLGLCPNPNHADRTPSWHIRDEPGHPKHGLHNCWSCGHSGNLTKLVMDLRGLKFRDAEAWLAENAPLTMDAVRTELRYHRVTTTPSEMLLTGVDFGPMEKWVTPAREYARSRGITDGQVLRWGVGVSVSGRLGGRIVFPKRASSGRLGGFSARSFVGEEPRYLEAKPNDGADPNLFFGEEHWEGATTCLVTEGVINALAAERAWPEAAVVALTGSNIRPMVLAKLAHFETIVLLTDPDAAGNRAAGELTDALGRHCDIKRVELPEGTDAAELPLWELKERVTECLS